MWGCRMISTGLLRMISTEFLRIMQKARGRIRVLVCVQNLNV